MKRVTMPFRAFACFSNECYIDELKENRTQTQRLSRKFLTVHLLMICIFLAVSSDESFE